MTKVNQSAIELDSHNPDDAIKHQTTHETSYVSDPVELQTVASKEIVINVLAGKENVNKQLPLPKHLKGKDEIMTATNYRNCSVDGNDDEFLKSKGVERSLESEFVQPLPPLPPSPSTLPVSSLSSAPTVPMLIKRDMDLQVSVYKNPDMNMKNVDPIQTGLVKRTGVNTQILKKDFLVMMLSEKDLSPYASFLLGDNKGHGSYDVDGSGDVEEEETVMMDNFMQMDSKALDAQSEAIMQRHNSIATFVSNVE